jgi:hypothetical protein
MAKASAEAKSVQKSANKSVKRKARKVTMVTVNKSAKRAAKRASKVVNAAAEKSTTRYIRSVPKSIPAGKILCHSGVIPETADQRPDSNGFRPWLDDETKSDKYGPCNCGWSGLPHQMPLGWLEHRKEYDARKFPLKAPNR